MTCVYAGVFLLCLLVAAALRPFAVLSFKYYDSLQASSGIGALALAACVSFQPIEPRHNQLLMICLLKA